MTLVFIWFYALFIYFLILWQKKHKILNVLNSIKDFYIDYTKNISINEYKFVVLTLKQTHAWQIQGDRVTEEKRRRDGVHTEGKAKKITKGQDIGL